jgi:hypothetical protein
MYELMDLFLMFMLGMWLAFTMVLIYDIRSFRKWLETRWYSDLKEKSDE